VDIVKLLAYVFIFPGFLFLLFYSLFCEWVDRKLYARMQHRVGPPWFQPFADFIKLLAKEDIEPAKASHRPFHYAPLFALAAVAVAIVCIPVWKNQALLPFPGDLIVVVYFLSSVPAFAIFIGAWKSRNFFAEVGVVRAMTQVFSYEIPFILAVLSVAIVSGSWSITEIASKQAGLHWYLFTVPIGFILALIGLLCKLERIPFDIPEAETEIVAGPFIEYSGRKYAMFRLMFDIEMVVGGALICALFLGGFTPLFSGAPVWTGIFMFIIKTLIIVFLLSLIKSLFARIKIKQLVSFSWKWLVPLGLLQIFIALIMRGVIG